MTGQRTAATRWVLLAALWLGGCAALPGPPAATPGPAASAAAPAAAAPAAAASGPATATGVRIEIEAPAELKALLERHLDLVRLGRVAREEVDDTEWSRLIDATPAQVRDLLQTEGYFSPQVKLERAPGRASGQPDLVRLLLDPGPRARVSRVTIEVEGELERSASAGEPLAVATLDQLRKAWDLPAGRDFRNPAWSEAKAAALARLRAAGYASAAWSGTGAEIDVEHDEVRLFVVADSGPLYRWGSLEVEGLVAQDIETVRNLVAARRGAPVTEALLLDFQERLQKAGLFETVSVTLDPDPAQAAEARILARLREAPLQTWTFGVGVSANTGPRASVEHLYRRVFGLAATSRVKIEVGKLRQAWDAEVSTNPGVGLYRNLIGGAVERLVSDTDVVLSQHVRLGRAQDAQRVERLFFAEADRSLRVTDAGDRNNAYALSLNFHGGWRNLDSVVLPTDGETLAIELGIGRSNGTNAVAGIFTRSYGRLTVYRPLGRTWYGQARLELGNVFLRPNMVVTESQEWRAGGDDSVRGYAYRSLGPLVDGAVGGGTSLFTASAELARPVSSSLPSLWGAVFVDVGNAANGFANLSPALGYGVGLRWRSPVGPLRVDWAYGREVHRSRLHFSIGIAF
jgi:translocation and assembly module TamA